MDSYSARECHAFHGNTYQSSVVAVTEIGYAVDAVAVTETVTDFVAVVVVDYVVAVGMIVVVVAWVIGV